MEADGSGGAGGGGSRSDGWSEEVEDMVDRGDVDGAISILESVFSRLQPVDRPPSPSHDLHLANVIGDLADLHSSRGFSLKADELRSRALAIRARARCSVTPLTPTLGDPPSLRSKVAVQAEIAASIASGECEDGDADSFTCPLTVITASGWDWEIIADRGLPDESFLSSNSGNEVVSCPSREGTEVVATPKRRGRGTFLYEKSCLYSEQVDSVSISEDGSNSEDASTESRGCSVDDDAGYGTSHVLVLYDFPPSTRTTELEKYFETYKEVGVAIRWVNDTVALAVFKTPTLARDAQRKIHFPFRVRFLRENDSLLNQLSIRDLQPPYRRPKTSARTAQRMIAQVMGIKPPPDFGSIDLGKQEEARKSRINARKSLRDDAWGPDDP